MDGFLTRALEEIERETGHLPIDDLERASGGQWSIAQILEHLALAFTLNRGALEKALASGELRAKRPRLSQRLARMLVVDLGYFPRVRAPEMTMPRGSIPAVRVVQETREALVALDRTFNRIAETFGERVAVANHPYFAGLSVAQWRKFHWRHTAHHMKQVRARTSR